MVTCRFHTLIFDLDDTLMDTWGQLVGPAAKEACAAMIQAGLNADLEACVSRRSQWFRDDPKSDVYLKLARHFGPRSGCDTSIDQLRDAGHHAYFHREVETHIQPFEAGVALLRALSGKHVLHLVTSGSPTTQARKVAILGLSGFFDSVIYVDRDAGQSKYQAFSTLIADEKETRGILCIGDRPDREIRAGNQLGFTTCRVRHGEFAHLEPADDMERAQYQINGIHELAPILT